jgi:hypothetical protein
MNDARIIRIKFFYSFKDNINIILNFYNKLFRYYRLINLSLAEIIDTLNFAKIHTIYKIRTRR